MTCLAGSDTSFGPRVPTHCRSFDFTLGFEDIVFACIPAAIFLVLSPLNLMALRQSKYVSLSRPRLLACKMAVWIAILATQLAFMALRVRQQAFATPASLAADILTLVATGTALSLSFLDHQRSLRPSTLLSLYLSAVTLLGIARTRTLWLIEADNSAPPTFTASFALSVFALVLELVEKKASLEPGKQADSPEQYSGFWNRTAFAWLAATFRIGYAKVISIDDLPNMDPQLQSHKLHHQLVSAWDQYEHNGRHSLLRACFRAFLPSLLAPVLPRLCLTAFTFFQPFLLNDTVTLIDQTRPNSDYGKGLIGAWALVFVGIAVSNSVYQYQNYRFASRLRVSLIALVYQRILETRAVDQGKVTAVSLMGTDIERIISGLEMLHEVWASLLDVAIATWLLERELSLACLAPVVLVTGFIFATSKLALVANRSQQRWIEKVQERLRVTSSMLDGLKAVKMSGLTQKLSSVVEQLRWDEIKTSETYRKVLVTMLLLSNTPIILAPTVTFAVYVIISIYAKGESSLQVAQAFTSLALISLLATPVVIFTQALPNVVQCLGCFARIQDYCNYAPTIDSPTEPAKERENDASAQIFQSSSPGDLELVNTAERGSAITFRNKSFRWNSSGPVILKNLDVSLEPRKLTVVTGSVGSGKSSFLLSILGEMIASPSDQQRRLRSVAYCAQQPWLEEGTIRQNIVGMYEYDDEWYGTVIACCDLDSDIKRFMDGDDTRVGSKGVSLSGGQKGRIALARAVYARQSVVLLDDVFSGMDAHTVDIICRRLLAQNGLLRKQQTTIIVVTNSRKAIACADRIVQLEHGKIMDIDKPTVLLENEEHIDKHEQTTASKQASESSSEPIRVNAVAITAKETDSRSEDLRRKHGELAIYKYYLASSGYLAVGSYVVFMALWMFFTEFSSIWLMWWSEANASRPNVRVGMYMGIYAMFGILGTICACVAAWFEFITMMSNSSMRLHEDLLSASLKAPFWFLASTDTGELLNRFSQDLELIDMALPMTLGNYASTAFSCLAKCVILIVFSRYLSATVPLLGTLLYFLQRIYLQTSRQVRLLGIEAKAPLYTLFSDSVDGAPTIRAFGWQSEYQNRAYRHIDTSQRPSYMQSCIQHWLAFVLDMMMAVVTVILVTIVVQWRSKFTTGAVGVSLVMIVGFSSSLTRLITNWTAMESSVGAVARIKRFMNETPSEGGKRSTFRRLQDWPPAGAITFEDIDASYKPDGKPVLTAISLSVQPQQHVAICGRTGSGKTSLLLSFLRMIELQKGRITIDTVDISSLSDEELRSHINVIPQDPFLMPITIRSNLDPFGHVSDSDAIQALARARLWTLIQEQGGLDAVVDFATWSAGQRQLFCLAQVMVRRSKILVLDEAMSSVDYETEALMQEIIDSEFRHTTVLAVMHRLDHIEQYDKVALIDNGRLVEYDRPSTLLTAQSRFAELYRSSRR